MKERTYKIYKLEKNSWDEEGIPDSLIYNPGFDIIYEQELKERYTREKRLEVAVIDSPRNFKVYKDEQGDLFMVVKGRKQTLIDWYKH